MRTVSLILMIVHWGGCFVLSSLILDACTPIEVSRKVEVPADQDCPVVELSPRPS